MYNVLVVDDELMNRISFQKLINWEKYNLKLVATCENGEEALDYILRNSIDILITDIKMPKMDGIALLRELKLRNIEFLATLVLSAFNEYQFIRESFKLKVDDYILKSDYDEDSIIEIILKLINNKIPCKDISTLENPVEKQFSYEINSTLAYLNKNYHKDISLNSISVQVGYSDAYLSHLFSSEMGVTITEYLTRLRVLKAKELLDSTNFKIYEVSYKVGFKNVEHFSRCFKKYEGLSPKQYKSK